VTGYREIAADLRHRIEAGEYPPGALLPTIAELTRSYGAARQTVRAAIASLAQNGLVDPVKRRGTVVLAPPTVQRLSRSRLAQSERRHGRGAFLSDAEVSGFMPSVTVGVRTEPATSRIAQQLAIRPDDLVLVRDRVMHADGVPVQVAVSRFPKTLTEGTAVEREDTGPGGVYARLEEAGHKLTRFTESVRSRLPTPVEAEVLRLRDGQHVLAVTRVAFAGATPVEVNDMVLTADRYELVYEISATEGGG
jgi:GntR family transcriptional regulator